MDATKPVVFVLTGTDVVPIGTVLMLLFGKYVTPLEWVIVPSEFRGTKLVPGENVVVLVVPAVSGLTGI